MNRLKKAAFGVLIAGIAFGFSAFTTVKNSNIKKYYKTDLTYPNASDPRGYIYYAENRCEAGGDLCTALWDIGSNPSPGNGTTLPLIGVTFQVGSAIDGHFD